MLPILHQSHWLPIDSWAQVNVLILSFKTLHVFGPGYLKGHLLPDPPAWELRLQRDAFLTVPPVRDAQLFYTESDLWCVKVSILYSDWKHLQGLSGTILTCHPLPDHFHWRSWGLNLGLLHAKQLLFLWATASEVLLFLVLKRGGLLLFWLTKTIHFTNYDFSSRSFQIPLPHEHAPCQLHGTFTCICSGVHWSKLTDLTLDMWTPKFRCIPAHLIQIKTPVFQEAHRGPKGVKKIKIIQDLARLIFLRVLAQRKRWRSRLAPENASNRLAFWGSRGIDGVRSAGL